MFNVGFSLGLLFDPEDGSEMFPQNVKKQRAEISFFWLLHVVSCLFYSSTLTMEEYFHPKRRLTFTELHGDISLMNELFIIQICSWL
jgi:hypothetical protein